MPITEFRHTVIGGGRGLVCHWPRQGGLWRWGDEMLAGYIESPGDYRDPGEVGHGQEGIWKRGYVRLRRSLDGGETWDNDGVLFDNSRPIEDQRQILHLDDYRSDAGRFTGPPRETIHMGSEDAILMMGRAWCGDDSVTSQGTTVRNNVAYCFRSPHRGETWETTPSIIWPHHTSTVVELANNAILLDGGRLLAWVVGYGGIEGAGLREGQTYSPQLYASDDDGVTWDFYSEIYCDPHNRIAASYPQIVRLPSGRWLCVLGCWFQAAGARIRWTSVCYSDDEGLNWSAPRRIHAWSVSPFPLLLEDGRLIIVFMRRTPDPTGLYVIVSDDEGAHWSAPACLRDDTIRAGPRGYIDGGYPVALQMGDGRIFTAYYWQHDDADVPWYGGRKFIGGTFFRVE